MPGKTAAMNPTPDHGEKSYKGSGRLNGKKAIITGGDSGIGRAVAIAYAREGADVLISYLDEHEDARETERLVQEAGRKAVLLPGDIQDPGQCRAVVAKAVSELGGIDILVNNAAHQASFKSIDEISDEEWELTFKVNIHAMFYLTKAAVGHMKPGSCIINTASINSDAPNPTLLAYATTKGAIHNFTAGLAQMLAEKGIRANAVAPGPIWTPLIPSTLPEDSVKNFGKQVPMKRPGQPVELATAYVMLADPLSSYVSGATIAVTGGKPFPVDARRLPLMMVAHYACSLSCGRLAHRTDCEHLLSQGRTKWLAHGLCERKNHLTGKSVKTCPALLAKIFRLTFVRPNHRHNSARLTADEGRSRSSRTRGEMRWTREPRLDVCG